MLARSMTHQNNRVHAHVNSNGVSKSAIVRDFVSMNPLEFLGSQTNEDPQNLLDEIKKIFEVMQVIGKLNGRKIELQMMLHITLYCFTKNLLDTFLPIVLKEAKSQEFMNLRQGYMIVQEYGLKFNQISLYAPHMVAYSRAQMNKFLYGL